MCFWQSSLRQKITLLHVIDILPFNAPSFYLPILGSLIYENDLTEMSNQHLNKLALAMKKKGVEKINIYSRHLYNKLKNAGEIMCE